jgi:hypothetical protein
MENNGFNTIDRKITLMYKIELFRFWNVTTVSRKVEPNGVQGWKSNSFKSIDFLFIQWKFNNIEKQEQFKLWNRKNQTYQINDELPVN